MEIKSWYNFGEGIVVNDNYHVVPKSVDPYNQYDFDKVAAFCVAHPELKSESATVQEETLEATIRKERDRLLVTDVDEINAVRWSAMSEEQQQEWTVYRQALLDVPQQSGFPGNVIWPEKPACKPVVISRP